MTNTQGVKESFAVALLVGCLLVFVEGLRYLFFGGALMLPTFYFLTSSYILLLLVLFLVVYPETFYWKKRKTLSTKAKLSCVIFLFSTITSAYLLLGFLMFRV